MVTYNSLDTLPIYNYVQLINGRFQYIIKADVDTLKEVDGEDKDVLIEAFKAACDKYEGESGKIDHKKISRETSIHDVQQMQALNTILESSYIGSVMILNDENKAELKDQMMCFGMKFNVKANNKKIERRIKEIEAEESKGDTLSISALMDSIAAMNEILSLNITEMCGTSLYFSYQKRVNKKISALNNANGKRL